MGFIENLRLFKSLDFDTLLVEKNGKKTSEHIVFWIMVIFIV